MDQTMRTDDEEDAAEPTTTAFDTAIITPNVARSASVSMANVGLQGEQLFETPPTVSEQGAASFSIGFDSPPCCDVALTTSLLSSCCDSGAHDCVVEKPKVCPRCTTNNGKHNCGIERKRPQIAPAHGRSSRRKQAEQSMPLDAATSISPRLIQLYYIVV
jgi:hypothetical protein